MSDSVMTRLQFGFLALIFLLFFIYCLHGAIVGDLYFPAGRGLAEVHLKGLNAWLYCIAPVLIYFSVLVRAEVFSDLNINRPVLVSRIMFWLGFALLAIGLNAQF